MLLLLLLLMMMMMMTMMMIVCRMTYGMDTLSEKNSTVLWCASMGNKIKLIK